GDVALSEKGEEVMLAEGKEVDVLHDHHLLVVDREKSIVQDPVDILAIAAGQKMKRPLHPARRSLQPFARGIFPQRNQKVFNELFEGGEVRFLFLHYLISRTFGKVVRFRHPFSSTSTMSSIRTAPISG